MNDRPVALRTPDTSVVETMSGRVRGAIIEGVAAFKMHPLRRADIRRQPLHAATQADALGGRARCAGLRGARAAAGSAPATRPELADFSGPPDTSPETEDCLTLNVWSPGP